MTLRTPRGRRPATTVGALVTGAVLAVGSAIAPAAATTAPATLTAAAAAAPGSHHDRARSDRAHPSGTRSNVELPAGFRPEGVESGPGGTYFVGSLADGTIRTGDLRRGTGRTLVPGVSGRSVRGLYLDPRSGLLWAAAQDGDTGIVLAADARTGAVRHRIVVPGAVFLNDLVVVRGAVWVTDSRVDRLTRIPLDRRGNAAGAPASLPLTGAWPTPEGLRANGIRALRDGTLVLDNSTAGGLWAVDPGTGVVTSIPVTGVPPITGGDGLELLGRLLYVVRGSGNQEVSVLRLTRGREGWSAEPLGVLTSPLLDVPSTATVADGRLWAVNARFGVADPGTAGYSIVALPLLP